MAVLCCVLLAVFFSSVDAAVTRAPPAFPSTYIQPEEVQIAVAASASSLYTERFYVQILDHFDYDPQSYQTFQQRYLINDTYWGGGSTNSPIFVYTGNEGNIEWFAQNTGFMFENAPKFKALLVFIEHRFYGKSIPFGGNKQVAYSNSSTLGYLSATQALADYATLILDLKKNLSAADSPVIVIGGSYGGMLATWFRLKYPNIATGALSSSAPILNFDNITSPYSFHDIVTQDFRSESESCYEGIKKSWQEIDDTASKPGGLENLRTAFRVCKNSTSAAPWVTNWLQKAFIYTAMTDYPTPSNFMALLPAYPVKQMCKEIDDPTTGANILEKVYRAANIYYNYSGKAKCFSMEDDSDPHGLSGWTWQACTEIVLLTGGNTEESIFPASNYSYNDLAEYCEYKYSIQPRPSWIATEFGGRNIYRYLKHFGSNIIFFNGLRDPWSGGGVLKDISRSLVAIVAKEGAHHVDLRYSTREDPEWLRRVREREVSTISRWLAEYYATLLDPESSI